MNTSESNAFDRGYVCAVAQIMNLFGAESIAREVLNANRPKDWSIIDEADKRSLQPIFEHEKAVESASSYDLVATPNVAAADFGDCVNCNHRIYRTGRQWYHQSSGGMSCALKHTNPPATNKV